MKNTCYICGRGGDLRPYGANSQFTCFPCAMGSPERATEAQKQFSMQLRAVPGVAVIDGTEAGPYPLENNPQAAAAYLALKGDGE